jgi:hypothetical protein
MPGSHADCEAIIDPVYCPHGIAYADYCANCRANTKPHAAPDYCTHPIVGTNACTICFPKPDSNPDPKSLAHAFANSGAYDHRCSDADPDCVAFAKSYTLIRAESDSNADAITITYTYKRANPIAKSYAVAAHSIAHGITESCSFCDPDTCGHSPTHPDYCSYGVTKRCSNR